MQEALAGKTSLMSDERWLKGFDLLSKYQLHFDLQTPWWHLNEARRLARDFPETLIILNHTGLPADRSQEGLTGWFKAMEEVAKQHNVVVKISGLGQKNQPWSVETNRKIVQEILAIFGIERCMFASNFPVDSLCVSQDTLWKGFKELVTHLPVQQQQALFYDNARQFYRIDETSLLRNIRKPVH